MALLLTASQETFGPNVFAVAASRNAAFLSETFVLSRDNATFADTTFAGLYCLCFFRVIIGTATTLLLLRYLIFATNNWVHCCGFTPFFFFSFQLQCSVPSLLFSFFFCRQFLVLSCHIPSKTSSLHNQKLSVFHNGYNI